MFCFIIKYSSRYDDCLKELSQMIDIFDNYLSNITVIITKSEGIEIKSKEELKIAFKGKFGVENVLFTNKNTDGYQLCEDLNKIKANMKNISQILVKTRDLLKH